MTNRGRELTSYMCDHKDDFVSLLQALVEQETPSGHPAAFIEINKLLHEQFEQLGFKVEHIEGSRSAGQLLCTPKGLDASAKTQLIIGHIDTVWDEGTLHEMPFAIEGNTAAGPGTYDMKAGIAMMILAMRAIKNLDKEMRIPPVFLITTDEETGSHESKQLIIEQAKRAERTFVLEPALDRDGKIKTRRKGVGVFEIIITGTPSHAGLEPEEGVSAILGLSHIVQQVFQLNDPASGITVNVGTIEGGERTNVIAAKSKARIDVRVPTVDDGKRITNEIYNLQPEIEGVKLEVTGGINRPPMEKTGENEKLWQRTQQLGKELDLDLQEGTSGGASDGNFTNLHSPTIDGLGAVGEGAHAHHEKIYIDKTLERTALFSLLLSQDSLF